MADFYDAGAVKQVAINLFYGWGYNFYRVENQLRADDQLIRRKAGELLGQANAALGRADSDFRRLRLPPPSREQPRADPDAVAGAQTLERMIRRIDALKGQIGAMPVPEGDRMTDRYRREAQTLHTLAEHDEQLVGQAEMLREWISGRDGQAVLDTAPSIDEGLSALEDTLRRRAALLSQTF